MSIQPIRPTPQTTKSKIKAKIVSFGEELKNYVEDFRKKEDPSKYVTIDGVKYPSYLIPNAIGRDDDYKSATWSRTKFYPEDLEKMKTMNIDERLEYKCKLLKEGRCIRED